MTIPYILNYYNNWGVRNVFSVRPYSNNVQAILAYNLAGHVWYKTIHVQISDTMTSKMAANLIWERKQDLLQQLYPTTTSRTSTNEDKKSNTMNHLARFKIDNYDHRSTDFQSNTALGRHASSTEPTPPLSLD